MIRTIYGVAHKGGYSNPFGAELYKTINRTVRRLAGKFYSILTKDDIADIVHDIYLKLLEKQEQADFSLNFDGWVFRSCQNKVNSYAKAKSKRYSWIVNLNEEGDDDEALFDLDRSSVLLDNSFKTDRNLLEKEFENKFWKAISRLNPDYRKVAILLMEDTPYEEMAKKLGCTENAVKTKVCRTRQALLKLGIAA